MAKYYPDIAKGAKGTRELRFWFVARAERERERDLSLSSPFLFFWTSASSIFSSSLTFSLSLWLLTTTDLFTGALSYENKFSLDAKPISGGVRTSSLFVYFSLLFFTFYSLLSLITREKREKDRRWIFSFVFPQNVVFSPGNSLSSLSSSWEEKDWPRAPLSLFSSQKRTK